MQIFFKTLTGRTLAQEVEPTTFINEAKAQIAAAEGIPADQQIMIAAGEELDDSCTFADYNIEDEAILNFVVDMCGGGKKRKKKNYTTPKKIKHKHKKVKLAVLKYYKVDDNGKITRLRRECPNSTCGAGVFMAWHTDRQYCGRCGLTYLLNKEESA